MSEEKFLKSNIDPPEMPYNSVGELIWHKIQNFDDNHVCMIDSRTDEQLTIGELKSRANSIAVALIQRGITKTDVIAFCGLNSIQHALMLFATHFLGNTFLPMSPAFGKYEVEQEMNRSGANVIISSVEGLPKFDNIINNTNNNVKLIVVFDGKHDQYVTFEQLLEEGRDQTLDQIPYFTVDPEKDMFFLIYTSGSTGAPKCAMMSHRCIMSVVLEKYTFLDINEYTGNVASLPFSFGHVSGNIIMPMQLIGGATSILLVNFDDEMLHKCIEKYQITFLAIFPIMSYKLIQGDLVDKYDLSSLKSIASGGSAFPVHISKALIEKYNVCFKEGYGMTEYTFITRGEEFGKDYIPRNCGPVSAGTEVKIVDLSTRESLGPNSEGEICVRGNKLFSGYLNNEQATKDAFDEGGWFRTGDIGYYNDEERIFIIDRLKETILVVTGTTYSNISPVEIELFLLTHPSVDDVIVVGIKNNAGFHWPRAYVVAKNGHDVTEEQIEQFVSDTLTYTKHLRGGVVFLDHLLKTSIGKNDRKYYRNLIKDEIID